MFSIGIDHTSCIPQKANHLARSAKMPKENPEAFGIFGAIEKYVRVLDLGDCIH